MDAIEFVKQLRRMDEKGALKNRFIYPCVGRETDSPEDVVAEVEEWAKMNPVKTRQSVFLEQWPEARIDKTTGVLTICPAELTKECRDDREACGAYSAVETCVCEPCRREFWMQEVE
jgi:hypothetical protein